MTVDRRGSAGVLASGLDPLWWTPDSGRGPEEGVPLWDVRRGIRMSSAEKRSRWGWPLKSRGRRRPAGWGVNETTLRNWVANHLAEEARQADPLAVSPSEFESCARCGRAGLPRRHQADARSRADRRHRAVRTSTWQRSLSSTCVIWPLKRCSPVVSAPDHDQADRWFVRGYNSAFQLTER